MSVRFITVALPAAIVATAICGAASADEHAPVRMQALLDRGFAVTAEGDLIEGVTCTRYTMRVLGGWREPDGCIGKVKQGSFKRLKSDGDEFVCVSFRDWACYESKS